MNISDVKIDWKELEGKNFIELLFEKQDELRQLYGVPICDLDVPEDQQQLRAMAWNVVEEAAEAIEVLARTTHKEHLLDELADMIAFYIELMIMSGLKAEDLKMNNDEYTSYRSYPIESSFMSFVSSLALAINTLKNRYWRKTNLKTDIKEYHIRLLETGSELSKFLRSIGIPFKELVDAYLRKHQVNLFRIRSKY